MCVNLSQEDADRMNKFLTDEEKRKAGLFWGKHVWDRDEMMAAVAEKEAAAKQLPIAA